MAPHGLELLGLVDLAHAAPADPSLDPIRPDLLAALKLVGGRGLLAALLARLPTAR